MSKSTICHIALFSFFRSKISSTKLVIFVVPGGTAIHSFDYLALNHLTRQLSRHPSNNVSGKTVNLNCFSSNVIRRMSAELFCEMVESKIIKSVNSSATKHNKTNQCSCFQFIDKNQLNFNAFFVYFRSKISSPTLVLFVVLGGATIHPFDYLALNHLPRQLSRHPSNYIAGKTG